jgi:ribosomal protein S18 acetylase RimI-like enzyme
LPLSFVPLAKEHDRAGFRCGVSDLDKWFHKRAGQDVRRNLARVFVALDDDGIAGFYSLSAFTLSLEEVPESLAAKLPRYDRIPAALIGRLARDERRRGGGIGELLVADAVRRVLSAAEEIAVFAIIVEAKDEAASTFYRRLGFVSFPANPRRLFMLTSTALAAAERAGAKKA